MEFKSLIVNLPSRIPTMDQKHLRELLVEDQEPFLLESYISDRRRQLNKPPRPLLLHPKSTSFRQSFLKNANACFSSSSSSCSSRYCNPNNSSPLPTRFDALALRARATTAGNNTVLLRVPKSTVALLLEAALRIENCDPKDRDSRDGKKQRKSGAGVGTVESLFRKFSKFGRRSRQKEFGGSEGGDGVLVRDILRLDNSGNRQNQGKASTHKIANTSKRKSSYVGKCVYSASEQREAHPEERGGRESFSDSELSDPRRSPFRYPTPELRSPAVSPTHSVLKDKVNYEENDLREIQPDDAEEVKKEQSSPVSVLDPPSDDDNVREHGHTDDYDNDEYEYTDGHDYEANYMRTKQQLLRKLYRFERLTGLDPVELEERMMEQDDSKDEDGDGGDSGAEDARKMKVTRGMMKSVSDLVAGDDHRRSAELVVDIDNMVLKGCFRQHGMRGRRDQEDHHLKDLAAEIEVSILGFLVEELSEELCLKRTFD